VVREPGEDFGFAPESASVMSTIYTAVRTAFGSSKLRLKTSILAISDAPRPNSRRAAARSVASGLLRLGERELDFGESDHVVLWPVLIRQMGGDG
jgi:hypothetical protein